MADEDSGYSYGGSLSNFDPREFWIQNKAFDFGTFEQLGFGIGPASISVLKTNSYLTSTNQSTMNYNFGPGSIDSNGVLSIGGSKSFLLGSVGGSVDSTGTLRGTISIPFKAQEKNVNVGPTYEKGWFADVNPLKVIAIYPMAALIHAQDRVDAAIAAASRCFPAHTPIAISATQTKPIADIRLGDTVLSFDPAANLGRGALVPRKVVRLYRNTTEEWVKLIWAEGGETKELIATPGHHFLDQFGNFPTIEEMLENRRATVILASGETAELNAERIIYTAETAHLFEKAQAVGMIAGNAALKTDKSVSHSPRYFATKAITFIIFASLSSLPAMADEPFNLRVQRVNQVLEELPVGGTKLMSDLIKSGNVENVCLVSTDAGIELNAGGCSVNSSSLVAVSRSKECSIVNFSQVTSSILSGSIDVECRLMSPSLALTKISRYGQTHILFIKE